MTTSKQLWAAFNTASGPVRSTETICHVSLKRSQKLKWPKERLRIQRVNQRTLPFPCVEPIVVAAAMLLRRIATEREREQNPTWLLSAIVVFSRWNTNTHETHKTEKVHHIFARIYTWTWLLPMNYAPKGGFHWNWSMTQYDASEIKQHSLQRNKQIRRWPHMAAWRASAEYCSVYDQLVVDAIIFKWFFEKFAFLFLRFDYFGGRLSWTRSSNLWPMLCERTGAFNGNPGIRGCMILRSFFPPFEKGPLFASHSHWV